MSKSDILAELPKLTSADRSEILDQLWSLDEQEALRRGPSAEEKALLDAELEDYAANPNAGSSQADVGQSLHVSRQLKLFVGRVRQLKETRLHLNVLTKDFRYEFHWHAGSEPELKCPDFHPDDLTAFLTICRPLINDTDGISCRQMGELLADSSAPNSVKKAWQDGRKFLNVYLNATTSTHVGTDPTSNRELILTFIYGEHIHFDRPHYRSKFEKFSKDAIAEAMMESALLGVLANTVMFLEQFQALAQQALDGFAAELEPA